MHKKSLTNSAERGCKSASSYREILSQLGVCLSYTSGVSMRPLIFTGVGYVAVVRVENPQLGDLLLFEQTRGKDTVTILHRLVATEGEIYVTRGDNCLKCERICKCDIIGRAENIYWNLLKRKRCSPHYWLPRLFGAKREGGSLVLNVRDNGYLLYSRLWMAIWPVRKVAYHLINFARRIYIKLWKKGRSVK